MFLVFVRDQTYIHTIDCLSSPVSGSGLSAAAVTGIGVVDLLLVSAAGVLVALVIHYRRKISELERRSGKYHTHSLYNMGKTKSLVTIKTITDEVQKRMY